LKPNTTSLLLLVLIASAILGCSRKNDSFINKAWHAVGTEYNILYNGDLALQQGLETVNNAFTENFWELLPIERFEAKDEIRLGDKAENSDFERAEEKAVKAIQKHSMVIDGKEKNPQIDEAYLLLGKSRYYDQRFVPALAAFNNILNKYPSSDKINQVKVWREKTNLRLGSPELTIKNLKRHLYQEDIQGQDLADISAVLAEAYLTVKKKDSALMYLDTAAVATKINAQKARYNYIRGQLYNQFGKPDSANLAFDEVIALHRKIPRAFYINAHLEKSNNFNPENDDKAAFLEYLTKLEENRENRPFLDKIYYRIAQYHQAETSDSLAEAYYNKSLRQTQGDTELNARNYLTLGNMYFDRTVYETAAAYYDSTLTNMEEKTKPYRTVQKKRKNLDDVIYYEGIAKANDSVLTLIKLPKDEQITIFNDYIKELKVKDSIEAEIVKSKTRASDAGKGFANQGFAGIAGSGRTNVPGAPGASGGNSDFYFYNPTTVAYGKNEFLKLWGERKLQDNWRLSTSRKGLKGNTENSKESQEVVTQLELYDPEYYIAQLPTEQKVIDSLQKERNFAYYQLGLIYKENFKEYTLAKDKLTDLLESNPEERLILPAKYNLYKIYELLGDTSKAEVAKNDIITGHPESRYAEILQNPNSELSKDENSPESIYENLYRKYEKQEYATVIAEAEKYITVFQGDGFVPKFEILKASAIGRLEGFEAYKKGVNYVALTYPNSEEGKQADAILKNAIPALENKEFLPQDEGEDFNVIYQFKDTERQTIAAFTKALEKEIAKITYYDWSLSQDVYNASTTFVVVHGLKSFSLAATFDQTLFDYKDKDAKPITRAFVPVSSYNYAIIQRHKNLDTYTNQNK